MSFRPDGLTIIITKLCTYGQPGDVKTLSYCTADMLCKRGYATHCVSPQMQPQPQPLEQQATAQAVTKEEFKVSAICPTYNRRVYLPSAISQFLAQTYRNSELLIVDDSTESVADLIPDNPRIRYIRLETAPRMLTGAKRNFCCENAGGDIIVHWDDDDWNGPDRIKDQVSQLRLSKKQVLSYCNTLYWNEITKMACRCFQKQYQAPHGATLCYEKSWWEKHPFTNVALGEDTQFGRRALSEKQFIVVDAKDNMVIRAHGTDYGDASIMNRGNTCETGNHMGSSSIPEVPISEIPSEFFLPLLKDEPVSGAQPFVVRFKGGLGNQMFQYAFGRSLSLARNIPVLFDKSYTLRDPLRSYSMNAYDVEINFDPTAGANRPWHPVKDLSSLVFNSSVLAAAPGTVFDGYWQTEKYFNIAVIRKELSRPHGEPNEETKRIAAEIQNTENSAFVHVRRTDYVNQRGAGMTRPVSYYVEGMGIVREKFPDTRFFIFTDDAAFCRQNFPGMEVVTANKPGNGYAVGAEHWDIWLMSLCRHAVIVNSTFAWWGAWLNPRTDRIVVAPKVWWPNAATETVPDRWTKLYSTII